MDIDTLHYLIEANFNWPGPGPDGLVDGRLGRASALANSNLIVFFWRGGESSENDRKTIGKRSEPAQKCSEPIQKQSENDPNRSKNDPKRFENNPKRSGNDPKSSRHNFQKFPKSMQNSPNTVRTANGCEPLLSQ